MFAIAGAFVFVIAGCVALFDKTISTNHLLVVFAVGFVLLCVHLAFRVWAPDGRRW
jgi:hypothetical protein